MPTATPPPEPPPPEWSLLAHVADFTRAAEALSGDHEPLAVDVERAAGIRYSDRPFLVQVRSRDGRALLLDTETAGRTLGPLAPLFCKRPLLLHAAAQDLPSLHMVGVRPGAIVDTELAGRFLGLPRVNLGAMVEAYLGIHLDKAYSAADWSTRPLPESWLDYAAFDVQFLHELADRLLPDLDEVGRREWFDAECAHLATLEPAGPDPEAWRRLSGLSRLTSTRQMARARELWRARDDLAAERDIAPKRLLQDTSIVTAAQSDPRDRSALLAIDGFDGPRRARFAPHWLAALRTADTLAESELPPRRLRRAPHPPHSAWGRSSPAAAELLARVRGDIAELADRLCIEHDLLLKPATVRLWVWRAASAPPARGDLVEEVLTEQGARRWQIDLVGPVLATALREQRRRR